MKLSVSVGIGILSLLLGVPAALYAQEEPKQEEPKAPKQEEPKPETKDEAKPPKSEKVKPPKDQGKEQENGSKAAQPSGQMGQTENGGSKASQSSAQMSQGQGSKAAGKSAHIPDNQFKAHFGRSHTFVVNQPVVVSGQQQFVYGGYTFVFVDPWPADWAYTDQCYVDYVDGEYVLFDLLHPGVSITLTVVM